MGHKLSSAVSSFELSKYLSLEMEGQDSAILNVAPYDGHTEGSLVFSKGVPDGHARIVIVPESARGEPIPTGGCYIYSSNPRLDFIRALDYLARDIGFQTYAFDSIIHPSASIGRNVVIEEQGCVIEEGVVIEHNVVIQKGTRIGKHSRVRVGSSVGGEGFGFERLADGTPVRFVHLGGVLIGEYVEIGALNSIVRGALSDTIIGDRVKTDNLVHIAHNCEIQDGALITACAEISGGVKVGKNAWIGPNACIIQKVKIGEGAFVGIGAVVTKNVEAECVYAGNPARLLRKI